MTEIDNLQEDIKEMKSQLKQIQSILIEQALTKKELDRTQNDILILESRVKECENQIDLMKTSRSSKYESTLKWLATSIGAILLGYIAIKVGLK